MKPSKVQMLLNEIQKVVSGQTYVIFDRLERKGTCFFTGMYEDSGEEEPNSMEEFRKTVAKIKAQKSWWRELIGRTDVYQIFN